MRVGLGLGVRTWLSLYEAMYMSPSGPHVMPTGPRTWLGLGLGLG